MTSKDIQLATPENAMRRIAETVAIACKYSSNTFLCTENKKINAKSLMGMMSILNGSESSLKVTAEGPDEEEAVKELAGWLAAI